MEHFFRILRPFWKSEQVRIHEHYLKFGKEHYAHFNISINYLKLEHFVSWWNFLSSRTLFIFGNIFLIHDHFLKSLTWKDNQKIIYLLGMRLQGPESFAYSKSMRHSRLKEFPHYTGPVGFPTGFYFLFWVHFLHFSAFRQHFSVFLFFFVFIYYFFTFYLFLPFSHVHFILFSIHVYFFQYMCTIFYTRWIFLEYKMYILSKTCSEHFSFPEYMSNVFSNTSTKYIFKLGKHFLTFYKHFSNYTNISFETNDFRFSNAMDNFWKEQIFLNYTNIVLHCINFLNTINIYF